MWRLYGIFLNGGRFFDIVIKEFAELASHRRNGGRVNSTTSPFQLNEKNEEMRHKIIRLS